MKSYKDGYLEGIVFVFFDDGKILVEHRPEGIAIIPGGAIEEGDKNKKEDYRIVAMKREVREELGVNVRRFRYLMDYKAEKVKIWLYVYLVTDWEGNIPGYSKEDGKRYAKLEWIKLKDYKKHLKWKSSQAICKRLLEM
jgi:8-oxo-dGTP pyrophosphatase MutT (NUDIX family)